MTKLNFIVPFFLFIGFSAFGQIKTTLADEDGFSVEYPENWEYNNTGLRGTAMIIMSPLESEDQFQENVNLLIQDMPDEKMTMDDFVDISEEQVSSMMTNTEIIESKRLKKGKLSIHQLIFAGETNGLSLIFEQRYMITNDKAYILTFSCEKAKYEDYKEAGKIILDSFKIK